LQELTSEIAAKTVAGLTSVAGGIIHGLILCNVSQPLSTGANLSIISANL